jgi:Rad3-related DNA helicase
MMTQRPSFPQSYENVPVREALESLAAEPSREGFDALLAAVRRGGLVIDVTGSTAETGTRLRTIASATGEPVLPLFTSIEQLKRAVQSATARTGTGADVQAVILPARDALELIATAPFVAVQFNPGGIGMTVARSHIEEILSTS